MGLVLLCVVFLIVLDVIVVILYDCLVEFGGVLIVDVFGKLFMVVEQQFVEGVIYVVKIEKVEVVIDWIKSVGELDCYICVFNLFFGV